MKGDLCPQRFLVFYYLTKIIFQIYHISRAQMLKYTNMFRPIMGKSSVSYSNRIDTDDAPIIGQNINIYARLI